MNEEKCGRCCGEDTADRVEVCEAVALLASNAAAVVCDGRPVPHDSLGRHGDVGVAVRRDGSLQLVHEDPRGEVQCR